MVTYDHKEILRILPFEKSVYRVSCAMVLSICVVTVVLQSVVRNAPVKMGKVKGWALLIILQIGWI